MGYCILYGQNGQNIKVKLTFPRPLWLYNWFSSLTHGKLLNPQQLLQRCKSKHCNISSFKRQNFFKGWLFLIFSGKMKYSKCCIKNVMSMYISTLFCNLHVENFYTCQFWHFADSKLQRVTDKPLSFLYWPIPIKNTHRSKSVV